MREQAARAEAERVTDLVGRVTRLVDAALTSGTLDEILSTLVQEVRGVLEADSATIMLTEQDERLSVRASSSVGSPPALLDPRRTARDDRPRRGFAGRVARAREAMLIHGPSPADLPDSGPQGGPWIP